MLVETHLFCEIELSLKPVINPREEIAQESVVGLWQKVDRRVGESFSVHEAAVVGLHHPTPGTYIVRSGILPQLLLVADGPHTTAEVFLEFFTNGKEEVLKHRVVASVQGSRKPDGGEGDHLRGLIERRRGIALRRSESEANLDRGSTRREADVELDGRYEHVSDARLDVDRCSIWGVGRGLGWFLCPFFLHGDSFLRKTVIEENRGLPVMSRIKAAFAASDFLIIQALARFRLVRDVLAFWHGEDNACSFSVYEHFSGPGPVFEKKP